MTDIPYFPLYVAEYEAATSFLTLEEDGLYMRLLRLCWNTSGCTVPDDREWLQKRLRLNADQMDKLDFIIYEYFTCSDARLSQKRLLEEYERVTTSRNARKQAGSKGGKARALKYKDKDFSNATVLPLANGKQCSSSKSKNNIKTIEENTKKNIYVEVQSHFNGVASNVGWSKIQRLSDARKVRLIKRINEAGGLDEWKCIIEKASQSNFLIGINKTNWKASFDFFLRESSFLKVTEGVYDNVKQVNGLTESNDAIDWEAEKGKTL